MPSYLDTSDPIRRGWKISRLDQFGLRETIQSGIPSREEADYQWNHLMKSFPSVKFLMTFIEVNEIEVKHA